MFIQANGFTTADTALKDGTVEGLRYMGVEHLWAGASEVVANHRFAGIKQAERLGILQATYGASEHIRHPAGSSGGNLAGTGVYTAVEIGLLIPNTLTGVVFDLNVST